MLLIEYYIQNGLDVYRGSLNIKHIKKLKKGYHNYQRI